MKWLNIMRDQQKNIKLEIINHKNEVLFPKGQDIAAPPKKNECQ